MQNLKCIVIFAIAGLLMALTGVPAQERRNDQKRGHRNDHRVGFEAVERDTVYNRVAAV